MNDRPAIKEKENREWAFAKDGQDAVCRLTGGELEFVRECRDPSGLLMRFHTSGTTLSCQPEMPYEVPDVGR